MQKNEHATEVLPKKDIKTGMRKSRKKQAMEVLRAKRAGMLATRHAKVKAKSSLDDALLGVQIATSRDPQGGLVWETSSIVFRPSEAQRKAFEAAREVMAKRERP